MRRCIQFKTSLSILVGHAKPVALWQGDWPEALPSSPEPPVRSVATAGAAPTESGISAVSNKLPCQCTAATCKKTFQENLLMYITWWSRWRTMPKCTIPTYTDYTVHLRSFEHSVATHTYRIESYIYNYIDLHIISRYFIYVLLQKQHHLTSRGAAQH